MNIHLIAFDADDTLWHNEYLYRKARTEFLHLFKGGTDGDLLGKYLDEVEIRNLEWYGYGIKSFALSMLQAAAEYIGNQLNGQQVMAIFSVIDTMIQAEVLLLDHARWCLERLHKLYPLLLITKGDLFEQERKIKRSGIQEFFTYFEVVGDKTQKSYQHLLTKYHCAPDNFLMVGNSLRSDILPVLQIGGYAVYVPYEQIWSHEEVDEAILSRYDYDEIKHLGDLPALVEELSK
jgi:putative hydrolase of the HAD superfamily